MNWWRKGGSQCWRERYGRVLLNLIKCNKALDFVLTIIVIFHGFIEWHIQFSFKICHFGFAMENILEWNKSRIKESGENIIVSIQ